MFTPQRLFGEVALSPDALSHEPFLERARLQREQDRDGSARLALGAYVVARLVDKLPLLGSDPELIEGFRWQLEAVRRHVDGLPDDAPETAHLAGVVAAVPEQGPATSGLWMSLTAYAYFLEHEARLDEALEILMVAARTQGAEPAIADFVGYALSAGRLNRQLARWDTAISCYEAAEEAASKIGDPLSALRGRLGKGAVHRGQGNYPLARSVAEDVVHKATELGLADAQAMAYADLGSIYTLQGLRLDALKAHYQAFQLSSDTLQQMRALSDLAIDLCEIGAREAARLAFQIVINSNAKLLVRANALLELMNLESSVGNRVAFERCRAAITEVGDRLSPSMATDYQFKLGTGLTRFGQIGRAREVFAAALTLAEAHGLNAWYFKIEQALNQLSIPREHEPEYQQTSEPSHPSVVGEVMVGLRDYAALAECK